MTFLKAAMNAKRKANGEAELTTPDFMRAVKEAGTALHIDSDMLKRALNVGFSGGEKKRAEILQMALLKPKMCILDETDSGLDIDALKLVSEGVNALRDPNPFDAVLVITHYQRLLNHIVPDVVRVFSDGKVVPAAARSWRSSSKPRAMPTSTKSRRKDFPEVLLSQSSSRRKPGSSIRSGRGWSPAEAARMSVLDTGFRRYDTGVIDKKLSIRPSRSVRLEAPRRIGMRVPVRLGAAENALIAQLQEAGAGGEAERLSVAGLPTTAGVEAYRYTDLKMLLRAVPPMADAVKGLTGVRQTQRHDADARLAGAFRIRDGQWPATVSPHARFPPV